VLDEPGIARNDQGFAAEGLEGGKVGRTDARKLDRQPRRTRLRGHLVVEVIDVVARPREQLHRLPAGIDEGGEDVSHEIDTGKRKTHPGALLPRQLGSRSGTAKRSPERTTAEVEVE